MVTDESRARDVTEMAVALPVLVWKWQTLLSVKLFYRGTSADRVHPALLRKIGFFVHSCHEKTSILNIPSACVTHAGMNGGWKGRNGGGKRKDKEEESRKDENKKKKNMKHGIAGSWKPDGSLCGCLLYSVCPLDGQYMNYRTDKSIRVTYPTETKYRSTQFLKVLASITSAWSLYQCRMTRYEKKVLTISLLYLKPFSDRQLFRVSWLAWSSSNLV